MLTAAGLMLCAPLAWLFVLLLLMLGEAAHQSGKALVTGVTFGVAGVMAYVGVRVLAMAGWLGCWL